VKTEPQNPRDASDEVILYQSPEGEVKLDVRLERETVWLSQAQMVELFGRDQSVISRHVRNIFKEDELPEESNMQKMHIANSDKPVTFYSLDTIISVGYRVKSLRGTQFRIWATKTLRDHLLKGYTLNEQRLLEKGLSEVEQAVTLLSRTLTRNELVSGAGRDALEIIEQYTRAWRLLLQYDEQRLADVPQHPVEPSAGLSLADASAAIDELRSLLHEHGEASDIFGRERAGHLGSILGALEQTFDGKPLYPTAQARAANLLYLVIKDHPFVDGNKRIGTLLFLDYLRRNGLLFRPDGRPRLADNTMVALSLLVAESESKQKELMIRLILNLIEDDE